MPVERRRFGHFPQTGGGWRRHDDEGEDMSDTIRALTVRQPWAELILRGRKPFELRSWKTKYRGPLLIHAAARIEAEFARELGLNPEKLQTRAFVGVALLTDVRPYSRKDSRLLKKNRAGGGWYPGLYSWVLKRPLRLPRQIDATGKLGLFTVSASISRKFERHIRRLGVSNSQNAHAQRSEATRRANSSRTARERSEAARKAWITRRKLQRSR